MTRRNDKRNNRRNRQRNNQPELSPFAQMLFGAILGKGAEMNAKKMAEIAEEKTPDIHAEGISNQDVTNINNGKATLSKLRIPSDGTAVEYPIPENLEFFFNEEGKLMVRKKQNGEPALNEETQEKPITYYDILRELYMGKTAYWIYDKCIESGKQSSYNFDDAVNCTSVAQAKRMVAFNKLQNIAKYLNNGWVSNFNGENKNWFICIDGGKYGAKFSKWFNDGSVFFNSEEDVEEAIRLMGEDSLNDLFSTDW